VDYVEGGFFRTLPFFVGSVVAGILFAVLVTRISRAQHGRLPELNSARKR
jgi:hypothetical protein